MEVATVVSKVLLHSLEVFVLTFHHQGAVV